METKKISLEQQIEELEIANNIIMGDIIIFKESVWEKKSFKRKRRSQPKFLGYRWIKGKVIKESYGKLTGQHTFTILVEDVEGYNECCVSPQKVYVGDKILRKGRNIYKEAYIVERTAENVDKIIADKNERRKKAKETKQLRRHFRKIGEYMEDEEF